MSWEIVSKSVPTDTNWDSTAVLVRWDRQTYRVWFGSHPTRLVAHCSAGKRSVEFIDGMVHGCTYTHLEKEVSLRVSARNRNRFRQLQAQLGILAYHEAIL